MKPSESSGYKLSVVRSAESTSFMTVHTPTVRTIASVLTV